MGLVFKMYANESPGGKYPPLIDDTPWVIFSGSGVDYPIDWEASCGGTTGCLEPVPGCIIPDTVAPFPKPYGAAPKSFFPEYLSDLNVLICPSSPRARSSADESLGVIRDDGSNTCPLDLRDWISTPQFFYGYFGHLVDQVEIGDPSWTDDGVEFNLTYHAYEEALFEAGWILGSGTDTDGDLPIPEWLSDAYGPGLGTGGSETFYRLREGIERFLITDINNPGASAKAQTEVHLSWDYVSATSDSTQAGHAGNVHFNHLPGGANVLYMDGHVEFVKYPGGPFPAHPAAANTIGIGA